MADKDALVLVFARNAFYKRLHYLVLMALTLSLIMICILGSLLTYLIKHPTHPLYFPADNVSRLLAFVPVSTPNMSTDDVIKWTVEAVEASYSYDFINYRAQLQTAQRYFTNYGWNNYMKALYASNNLVSLAVGHFVENAQVIDKPKLITEGRLAGAYAWKLEMPLLVTVSKPPYDDNSKFLQAWTVSVVVQRQSELQGYKGLGIVQLIAAEAENQPGTASETISTTPAGTDTSSNPGT